MVVEQRHSSARHSLPLTTTYREREGISNFHFAIYNWWWWNKDSVCETLTSHWRRRSQGGYNRIFLLFVYIVRGIIGISKFSAFFFPFNQNTFVTIVVTHINIDIIGISKKIKFLVPVSPQPFLRSPTKGKTQSKHTGKCQKRKGQCPLCH